jgi:hypothetical protein
LIEEFFKAHQYTVAALGVLGTFSAAGEEISHHQMTIA